MKLLRAATLSVATLDRSLETYTRWLDYRVVEQGTVDTGLATSWGAPDVAGRLMAVLRPASGADIFLRLVENEVHPEFRPLRTWGWAAIEINVLDVLAAAARLAGSPFEVIGPPREIENLPAIYPMQVRGPDGEIVYLTQVRSDLPDFDIARAQAPIDRLFIMVMACSDLPASLRWMEQHTSLQVGRPHLEIVYTMLANAFELPHEQMHVIATMVDGRDVFLELDQYPPQATARPRHAGGLPQGIAVGSLLTPHFDAVVDASAACRVTQAQVHASVVYGGARSVTLRAPDGTLVEMIEQRA
jgi:catechol 2,3-dioxygenase-like lactoylglutathione lyase family enzyme